MLGSGHCFNQSFNMRQEELEVKQKMWAQYCFVAGSQEQRSERPGSQRISRSWPLLLLEDPWKDGSMKLPTTGKRLSVRRVFEPLSPSPRTWWLYSRRKAGSGIIRVLKAFHHDKAVVPGEEAVWLIKILGPHFKIIKMHRPPRRLMKGSTAGSVEHLCERPSTVPKGSQCDLDQRNVRVVQKVIFFSWSPLSCRGLCELWCCPVD